MGKRILAVGVAFALVLTSQTAVAEPELAQPDPLLAFLPDPTKIDWAAVRHSREEKLKARTKATTAGLTYQEREAPGVKGGNDTPATAERVAKYEGSARITGDLADGDSDFFAVDLRAGDVLGGSVAGNAKRLAIHDATGREAMGSTQDFTFAYPAESPLPGGGNAVADFVAPRDGRYTIGISNRVGAYTVTVESYRPGTEAEPRFTVQTLFLDFDGARVNTKIYLGPVPEAGVRELSPLSAFLANWGLTAKDENAVIDAVVATVKENIERDLALKGTNHRFAVRVLNSRDHADPFGQPNVSRVVIGGTTKESGIGTVGIAQSIDPGNFGHEETALLLLDLVSQPAGPAVSLNTYVTAASDRTRFVGRALGNVTAHEAGHMAGSWHVDPFNDVHSIMDQGGNPKVMFAIGPDGVGGTADDTDVDFTEDVFAPTEGFRGTEDTVNRSAWAFTRGRS